MDYRELLSHMEWDHFKIGVKETYIVSELIEIPEEVPGLKHIKSLVVERDESDYSLRGIIKLSYNYEIREIIKYFNNHVYGRKIPHFKSSFKTNNCSVSFSFYVNNAPLFPNEDTYDLYISIDWIEVIFKDDVVSEREYYVNSTTSILHNASRGREIKVVIKDKLEDKDKKHSEVFKQGGTYFSRGSESILTIGDAKLIVATVKDEFTGRDSDCLSLWSFYPNDLDEEKKKRIAEFISFLMGRRLCMVGAKRFDENGSVSSYRSVAPIWYTSAIRQRLTPPIVNPKTECIFPYFSVMLNEFLEKYEEYNFGSALYYYWMASTQTIELSSPVYEQVVQILNKAYFKRRGQKKHIVDPEEYREISDKWKKSLKDSSLPHNAREAIIKKINNLNYESEGSKANEVVEKFGIVLSKEELELRGSVNKLRHPSEISFEDMKNLNFFYVTYVNRLILAMLGAIDVGYLDHTTGERKHGHDDKSSKSDSE